MSDVKKEEVKTEQPEKSRLELARENFFEGFDLNEKDYLERIERISNTFKKHYMDLHASFLTFLEKIKEIVLTLPTTDKAKIAIEQSAAIHAESIGKMLPMMKATTATIENKYVKDFNDLVSVYSHANDVAKAWSAEYLALSDAFSLCVAYARTCVNRTDSIDVREKFMQLINAATIAQQAAISRVNNDRIRNVYYTFKMLFTNKTSL